MAQPNPSDDKPPRQRNWLVRFIARRMDAIFIFFYLVALTGIAYAIHMRP